MNALLPTVQRSPASFIHLSFIPRPIIRHQQVGRFGQHQREVPLDGREACERRESQGRTHRAVMPRYTRPIPLAAQGGLAGPIASALIEKFGAHVDLALIEAKIGRVLSAANENRIQNARDLLNQVLTTSDASASAA